MKEGQDSKLAGRGKQYRSLAQAQVLGFHEVRKHRVIKKGNENRMQEMFSGETLGTGQLTGSYFNNPDIA